MSQEPNHRIEDELQAYAKQRREQAGGPFELHPVTRKALQDEVGRVLGGTSTVSSAEGSRSWMRLLWPRLALAGVFCAILALGVSQILFPGHKGPMELAAVDEADANRRLLPDPELQKAQPERRVDAPAPSPASVVEPRTEAVAMAAMPAEAGVIEAKGTLASTVSPAKGDAKVAKRTEVDSKRGEIQVSAKDGASATSVDDQMRRRYGRAVAQGRGVNAPAVAPSAAPAAPLPASKLDRAESDLPVAQQEIPVGSTMTRDAEMQSADMGGRFVQAEARRRNLNSPPLPNVLQSFRLRQEQQRIVVVDADGSIYQGAVGSAEARGLSGLGGKPGPGAGGVATVSETTDSRDPRQGAGAVAGASGWIPFVVMGTNQTLNMTVVFEGEYLPSVAGVLSDSMEQATAGMEKTKAETSARLSAARSSSGQAIEAQRVQGRVVLGDKSSLEINATRVQP